MPRVWDDVAFGPINMGLAEDVVRENVRKALGATSLAGFEERAPHNLSRGEKKRVAIAGVLAMEPEILFLDEPTAELDRQGRRDLIGVLNGLHTTMLVATHDVQTALEITNRAVVIDHSKLGEGIYPELFSNRDLLDRASLEMPPIPKLFELLEKDGISLGRPTSVEEAAEILRKALLSRS
jgi:cobalt/nickel transport system ATP-binding protein